MISELNDFSSKNAMESDGWTFNWNDQNVFLSGQKYCKNVPSTSYCGFSSTGDGIITYKFFKAGTAKLIYGQSSDQGSVNVRKNNMVIDFLSSRGESTTIFDYASGDVLQIEEIGESVINIHSMTLTPRGTIYLNSLSLFFFKMYINLSDTSPIILNFQIQNIPIMSSRRMFFLNICLICLHRN